MMKVWLQLQMIKEKNMKCLSTSCSRRRAQGRRHDSTVATLRAYRDMREREASFTLVKSLENKNFIKDLTNVNCDSSTFQVN
jgi:hypothetical protein